MIRANKKDLIFLQGNCTMNVMYPSLSKSFALSIYSRVPMKNSTKYIAICNHDVSLKDDYCVPFFNLKFHEINQHEIINYCLAFSPPPELKILPALVKLSWKTEIEPLPYIKKSQIITNMIVVSSHVGALVKLLPSFCGLKFFINRLWARKKETRACQMLVATGKREI